MNSDKYHLIYIGIVLMFVFAVIFILCNNSTKSDKYFYESIKDMGDMEKCYYICYHEHHPSMASYGACMEKCDKLYNIETFKNTKCDEILQLLK